MVHEDRLGEPLLGMGLEHISEDFGLRPLRISQERRIEPLDKQAGPYVDLARGGAERQVTFDPQVLKRQRNNANNRDSDDNRNCRRISSPANARDQESATHAFEGANWSTHPRRGEPKRRFPAQRSGWPFRTSAPVCRAYTRHRPSQTSPQITLGQPPLGPNHYDKNPCANLCLGLDRGAAEKMWLNGGYGRIGSRRPGLAE